MVPESEKNSWCQERLAAIPELLELKMDVDLKTQKMCKCIHLQALFGCFINSYEKEICFIFVTLSHESSHESQLLISPSDRNSHWVLIWVFSLLCKIMFFGLHITK